MKDLLDFFSNIADGVLAVDQEHRIIFWNEAAEHHIGRKAHEVLGHFCYEVIAGRDESGRIFCHADCLNNIQSLTREPIATRNILVPTRTGREIWLSLSTVLVPSAWRELCVLVHLFRNVTYQKELERSVQQLLTTLSKLSVRQESDLLLNGTVFSDLPDLTRREQEILRFLASGLTTKAIAEKLFITAATVRNHIHNMLVKLGVRNRLEAATLALRRGLI